VRPSVTITGRPKRLRFGVTHKPVARNLATPDHKGAENIDLRRRFSGRNNGETL